MCSIEDYSKLRLCASHRGYVNSELDLWHEHYSNVEGKGVLDVGGGCGETAFFFLMHGARSVFSFEQNYECFANAKWNGENVFKPFAVQGRVVYFAFGGSVNFVKIDLDHYTPEIMIQKPTDSGGTAILLHDFKDGYGIYSVVRENQGK